MSGENDIRTSDTQTNENMISGLKQQLVIREAERINQDDVIHAYQEQLLNVQRYVKKNETALAAQQDLIRSLQKELTFYRTDPPKEIPVIAAGSQDTEVGLVTIGNQLAPPSNITTEQALKHLIAYLLDRLQLLGFVKRHDLFFRKIYRFVLRILMLCKANRSQTGITAPAQVVSGQGETSGLRLSQGNSSQYSHAPNTPHHQVKALQDNIQSLLTIEHALQHAIESLLQENGAATDLSPYLKTPFVKAFLTVRSMDGDIADEALELLYGMGQRLPYVLGFPPSPRNQQVLIMLAHAGASVSCLAPDADITEPLLAPGITPLQNNVTTLLQQDDPIALAGYDGLILDADLDDQTILSLKGYLWERNTLLITGFNSRTEDKIRALIPFHETRAYVMHGVAVLETPPKSWLRPASRNEDFFQG